MSSRQNILCRIRSELARGPTLPQPTIAPLWPCENLSTAKLADLFVAELEAVHGEVIRCTSMDDARRKLGQLVEDKGWASVGISSDPLCRELVGQLQSPRVASVEDDWPTRDIAQLPVGLVAAELLLADTGTCVVQAATAQNRLLCYLPPVCLVAARLDQLTEHMSAAWAQIASLVSDPERRGEVVFITGPSRTADIEKYLVLGAHGPRQLVVILIG